MVNNIVIIVLLILLTLFYFVSVKNDLIVQPNNAVVTFPKNEIVTPIVKNETTQITGKTEDHFFNELNSKNFTVREIISKTAELENISLKDTGYIYNVNDMSKNSFAKNMIRLWDRKKVNYTKEDVKNLNKSIYALDSDIAKGTALILSAINDAAVLKEQAVSKLTEDDKEYLENKLLEIQSIRITFRNQTNTSSQDIISKIDTSVSSEDKRKINQILSKIDKEKQRRGTMYILDAIEKAKPYLEKNSSIPTNASRCAQGAVVFEYYIDSISGPCFIVVGGYGPNKYVRNHVLSIDLGGDDTYLNSAGGIGEENEFDIDKVAVSIDLGNGNDIYECDIYCQGSGLYGLGILVDYGGNNQYACYEYCQGYGAFGGIGILIDYQGNDKHICSNDCQGNGAFDGIGILADYGDGNDNFRCNNYCQGFGNAENGIGILVDYIGVNNYSCQGFCQGLNFAKLGTGVIIDSSGKNLAENGTVQESSDDFKLCRSRWLNEYSCSGKNSERQYRLLSCDFQWEKWEACSSGCSNGLCISSECDPNLWNNIYSPTRLQLIESCKSVTGIVIGLAEQPDGDMHIQMKPDKNQENILNSVNINSQNGALVLEPICLPNNHYTRLIQRCNGYNHTVFIPDVGDHIKVTGSYVTDLQHGWNEIHPVSKIEVQ